MTKQWAKEEAHRNEIAVAVESAVYWTMAHREAAIGVALTLVIGGSLAIWSFVRHSDNKRTAWERLAMAQSYAFAGQGKPALDQLKGVEKDFPNARAAGFAQIFEGDLEYQSGLYKEAIASYNKALERRDATLDPFARSGIAFSQEAGGQFEPAVEAAKQFLETHSDHFLAPQVHAVQARSLRALGKAEESRATLERMTLLYAETFWAQWAQNELTPPAKAPAPPKPIKAKPAVPAVAPAPLPSPAAPAPTPGSPVAPAQP